MTDKKILWLIMGIALLAVALGIGWLRFEQKQEELKRNRKYEVSLVKALKNSYEGIEEIRISDPSYSHKPGDWSCEVTLIFSSREKIVYGITHYLDEKQNYDGYMGGDTNKEINSKWDALYAHKGKTKTPVKVVYSDGTRGEQ